MKHYSHRPILACLFMASLLGLSACGGDSTASQSDGDVTLSFWAYQPSQQTDQEAFKTLISNFTAESGIKVKLNLVVKDSYNTALTSALTSRSKPDMAYLDQPLIADFAKKKQIIDLTSYLKDDADFSSTRFFDGAYKTCLYNGLQYGVPLNMTSTVLFYNTDIVTTAPTDWASWLATPLSGSNSLFDGIGTGGYAGWYYQCFLANNGGTLMSDDLKNVTFNDAKGVAAAKMMQDLYTFDNPTAITNRNASNAFGRGVVAYRLGSSSDIDTLDTNFPNLNYNVCVMPPEKTGGTSYSNMGGENLVVMNSSSHQNQCVKLMKYLLKETSIERVSNFTGNFPAIKEYADITKVPVVKETSRAKKGVILTQMQNAVARPVIAKWLSVNDDYLGTAISDKILNAEDASARSDIQGALNTAAEAAQQILFA
jgi:multiple sugar transport system substrate-binding protein